MVKVKKCMVGVKQYMKKVKRYMVKVKWYKYGWGKTAYEKLKIAYSPEVA